MDVDAFCSSRFDNIAFNTSFKTSQQNKISSHRLEINRNLTLVKVRKNFRKIIVNISKIHLIFRRAIRDCSFPEFTSCAWSWPIPEFTSCVRSRPIPEFTSCPCSTDQSQNSPCAQYLPILESTLCLAPSNPKIHLISLVLTSFL